MPLAGTRVGRRHSCGTGVGVGCHHHPGGRVWDSLRAFSGCPRLDSISLAPPGKLRPDRVPSPRMTLAGSPPGIPRGHATRAHPAIGCSSPGPLQALCARRFPWQPRKPASFALGLAAGTVTSAAPPQRVPRHPCLSPRSPRLPRVPVVAQRQLLSHPRPPPIFLLAPRTHLSSARQPRPPRAAPTPAVSRAGARLEAPPAGRATDRARLPRGRGLRGGACEGGEPGEVNGNLTPQRPMGRDEALSGRGHTHWGGPGPGEI